MNMNPCGPRQALWALAALVSLPVAAQTASSTIVVTGNPLGREGLLRADSTLAGDGLLVRRGATLGDTLGSLPGTAGSGFGPNSNRPVVRGLDGDRVRLLDNGGASIDASNLSFDHAVATDPLVAERIELLRGPAALLYGGSATGGVVNSIDNRIPRSPQAGLSGRAELRAGGAASERAAAAVIDGGAGALAWHVDAYGRRQSDLRTPTHVPLEEGDPLDPTDRVRNSAARTEGGAAGVSWATREGHLGLAVDGHRQRYGVTVEPDVTIRLRRERLALSGERRLAAGPLEAVSLDASHTRYRHLEVEGSGEVGTTFSSRGQELRLQARHRALGPWRGVLGAQLERLDFSALGEEAFVPGTQTRSQALFALEEAEFGRWLLQAGARVERVRVGSDGDAPDAPEERFGPAQQRRFEPVSAALGLAWRSGDGWAWALSAGHTERAPAYYELYANGVHVATAAFERGDPTLGVERSRNLQATLEWTRGAHRLKASAHDTRFARYLSLAASGAEVPDEEGGALPEYRFEAVRARLRGFEVEARWRAVDAGWKLDLSALADRVRGDDLDRGEPLPRIAPGRVRLALDVTAGAWAAGVSVQRTDAQRRVAAGDTATPGHTLWNAWATWRPQHLGDRVTAYLRLDNLTDRLAYNAVAVPTVRGLSPLGGRAAGAGVRVQW